MTRFTTEAQVTHGARRPATSEDPALYARLHPSCPKCRRVMDVIEEDGEERYVCAWGHLFSLVEIDEAMAGVGR